MPQYVVVSDAHGDATILDKIQQKYQDQVAQLFYLGDAELDYHDPSLQAYRLVGGNMDIDPAFPDDDLYQDPTARIYLAHGHRYHTERGLLPLLLAGRERAADIILTGHTHQLGAEMIKNCLIVNPGSIALPRGPYASLGGTYAELTVTEQAFDLAFYDRHLVEVPSLHVHFARQRS